ncbi:MAG: hypothetical protein IPP56_14685 [Bacteroidetes bacterium]|nr:hypothetical protein [Bacteroidota bacterium]MBK9800908.1 hypothetical protein [Bacteroidota bacterium]MBP6412460.1 hypothetical protein [Bacteroidia bacterium]
MDLIAEEIYDILIEKEVKALYHANSVRTSKTFLQQGGLLSRKYVEDNKLVQTIQKSDDKDKIFNIWDDIFLDAINISRYFTQYNVYGPILFAFRLDLLKNKEVKTVRITKRNPLYWREGEGNVERYFQTVEDFKSKFKSGNKLNDGGYHITFTTLNGFLSFKHLEAIQIDNPGVYVTNSKGEKKLISDCIIQYFSEDLSKNYISMDQVYVRDDLTLKFQYRILNQFRKQVFRRLFLPE